MLTDAERHALQRHTALIDQYEREQQEERERLYAPHAARLTALQHQAESSVEQLGPNYFRSRGYTTDESQEVFETRGRIEAGVGAYDRAHRPRIEPWDTPAKLSAYVDQAAWHWGVRHELLEASGIQVAEGEREKQDAKAQRDAYRAARERVLAFVRLAPSVLRDFPEAADPCIGLQDIRAWCEDAQRLELLCDHGPQRPEDVAQEADAADTLPKFIDFLQRRFDELHYGGGMQQYRAAWDNRGDWSKNRVIIACKAADRFGIDRDPLPAGLVSGAEEFAFIDRLLLAARRKSNVSGATLAIPTNGQPTEDLTDWLNLAKAAEEKGVDKSTIKRAADRGDLGVVRNRGQERIVNPAALAAWAPKDKTRQTREQQQAMDEVAANRETAKPAPKSSRATEGADRYVYCRKCGASSPRFSDGKEPDECPKCSGSDWEVRVPKAAPRPR